MSGPGSGGNVLAALRSFFIPGLGQLLQGRLFTAAIYFLLWIILWFVWLGILMHIWPAYGAAVFVPRA